MITVARIESELDYWFSAQEGPNYVPLWVCAFIALSFGFVPAVSVVFLGRASQGTPGYNFGFTRAATGELGLSAFHLAEVGTEMRFAAGQDPKGRIGPGHRTWNHGVRRLSPSQRAA